MSQPIRLASALGAPGAPSALSRWLSARLDDAADAFASLDEGLRSRRKALFIEQEDGTLVGLGGRAQIEGGRVAFTSAAAALRRAAVEFRLRPQRCVFRELELPARAGEFLEGVVRSQIDRLTPWRESQCAYGWSAPRPLEAGRIAITVAATKREPIAAFLDVAAESVAVTCARDGEAAPILLLSRGAGAVSRRGRWRGILIAVLAVSLVCAAAAVAADWTLGASLRSETDALANSLAERRAALRGAERALGDPATLALDARKRATPAAVVVLEALSRAIPDNAHLTQMRLAGDTVEISGVAADAAALVKHIEQSPHFARATFTAPTTRVADNTESFRIEAHVAPLFSVSP